jgi:hypothetical protein
MAQAAPAASSAPRIMTVCLPRISPVGNVVPPRAVRRQSLSALLTLCPTEAEISISAAAYARGRLLLLDPSSTRAATRTATAHRGEAGAAPFLWRISGLLRSRGGGPAFMRPRVSPRRRRRGCICPYCSRRSDDDVSGLHRQHPRRARDDSTARSAPEHARWRGKRSLL